MGKMSLNKGQNFERQIAKIFSEWSGVQLVRTPMSGAWEGCEVDIWPENPEIYWPLAIECKKAESWNMDQVMEGVGPVYEWLKQAEQQAKEWGDRTNKPRLPLLVFSRNRKPVYTIFPIECFLVMDWEDETPLIHLANGEYCLSWLETLLHNWNPNNLAVAAERWINLRIIREGRYSMSYKVGEVPSAIQCQTGGSSIQ